jgi:hypothetical protein
MLSEHDRLALEGIERDLLKRDPEFAVLFRDTGAPPRHMDGAGPGVVRCGSMSDASALLRGLLAGGLLLVLLGGINVSVVVLVGGAVMALLAVLCAATCPRPRPT